MREPFVERRRRHAKPSRSWAHWGRVLVLLLIPALNLVVWRHLLSSSMVAVDLPKLACISWDPNHRTDFDPSAPEVVEEAALRQDLGVIATVSQCARSYRATYGMERSPALAAEQGLRMILGASLLPNDDALNVREIESLIRAANASPNVTHVVVGNETQVNLGNPDARLVPLAELRDHLREVRSRVEQPVSTAEPHGWWLRHPEMADEVDFIGAHIIPYWDGVSNEDAVQWVLDKHRELVAAFPGKPVMILETGWPSRGPTYLRAVPGKQEQIRFLGALGLEAERRNLFFSVIEAFDQPWKTQTWEGSAGAGWGLFDAERSPKFSGQELSFSSHGWLRWGMAASLLGLVALLGFGFALPESNLRGLGLGILSIQAIASALVLFCRLMVIDYQVETFAGWALLLLMVVLAAILTVRIIEGIPVVGSARLRADTPTTVRSTNGLEPFVSIHLPCRNEPPEVVIATIRSLVALDYPSFEVIVVDNNTTDGRFWRPLEEFCQSAGPRVRFFHVERLEGYKAGALNYALARSDAATELVAVIDSDYVVDPAWLATAVPLFSRSAVACVQAPQAFRDFEASRFQTRARDEYIGFFQIGMVQRNEANALIQHGTMSIVRKSVLQSVGGWATWCIVEDAELGFRILEAGHEVAYVNRELGWGLVPATFREFSRQRERWAYGAVRIMAHHWRQLVGARPGLSWRQRYHFVAGWLPWLGESLHPLFSVAGLFVAATLLVRPRAAPALEYALPLIGFTVIQSMTTVLTYRARVRLRWGRTLATLGLGAALTPTISRAVLRGFFTSRFGFHVTAKDRPGAGDRASHESAWRWIAAHAAVGSLLLAGAALLFAKNGFSAQSVAWGAAFTCQSLPSLCAAWYGFRH